MIGAILMKFGRAPTTLMIFIFPNSLSASDGNRTTFDGVADHLSVLPRKLISVEMLVNIRMAAGPEAFGELAIGRQCFDRRDQRMLVLWLDTNTSIGVLHKPGGASFDTKDNWLGHSGRLK